MSLRGAKRRGNLLVKGYDTRNPKAMVQPIPFIPHAENPMFPREIATSLRSSE